MTRVEQVLSEQMLLVWDFCVTCLLVVKDECWRQRSFNAGTDLLTTTKYRMNVAMKV